MNANDKDFRRLRKFLNYYSKYGISKMILDSSRTLVLPKSKQHKLMVYYCYYFSNKGILSITDDSDTFSFTDEDGKVKNSIIWSLSYNFRRDNIDLLKFYYVL